MERCCADECQAVHHTNESLSRLVQTIAEILEKLDVQAVVCFWPPLPLLLLLLLLLHIMLVSDMQHQSSANKASDGVAACCPSFCFTIFDLCALTCFWKGLSIGGCHTRVIATGGHMNFGEMLT
jgi:hypothetical protein